MPFPAKTSTEAIIHSAADIIRSGGLASLSMRTLAARLGVRASSLYRHFPDRLSIEKTLGNRAAVQLLDCMRQSIQGVSGDRAVFAAARAYLDYATIESSFYDILMLSSVTKPSSAESTKQIWEFFVNLVSESTQMSGDVSGAAALWSFLHGYAVLARSGQLGESESKSSFTRGVQALFRGLSVLDASAVRSPS